MLSGADDLVAGALPVVCVVAGTPLVALAMVILLVRDVAARAIARANPDQVAAVIVALAQLITAFRSIWPWSAKASTLRNRTTQKAVDNDPGSDEAAGGEP